MDTLRPGISGSAVCREPVCRREDLQNTQGKRPKEPWQAKPASPILYIVASFQDSDLMKLFFGAGWDPAHAVLERKAHRAAAYESYRIR